MNDIENDDDYAKASAQYQELLREALPFLEKAEAINGMDKNTLIMLRMVYSRLEVPEGAPDYKSKLEAVEAKLKELDRKK